MLSKIFSKLLCSKSVFLESVGFDCVQDLLITVIGVKEKNNAIPALALALGTMFSILTKYLDILVYTPAMAIVILLGVSVFDMVLGVSASLAIKDETGHNKFNEFKLLRSGARFTIQVVLVAIMYHLHKLFPNVIYKGISDALVLLFILTTVWSGIKNAHKLQWITDEQYEAIEGVLSVDQIIKKFIPKKS